MRIEISSINIQVINITLAICRRPHQTKQKKYESIIICIRACSDNEMTNKKPVTETKVRESAQH